MHDLENYIAILLHAGVDFDIHDCDGYTTVTHSECDGDNIFTITFFFNEETGKCYDFTFLAEVV